MQPSIIEALDFATRERAMGYFYTFYNALPNPDDVLKKLGMTPTAAYDQIKTDAKIRSCELYMRSRLLDKELRLKYAEGADAKQIELCTEYLSTVINVKSVALEAWAAWEYGFKVFSLIWTKYKGAVVPIPRGKPNGWFYYSSDNKLMMYQSQAAQGFEVDMNYASVATNEPTYENPYGWAALKHTYWPWFMKKNAWKFWAKLSQRWGIPFILGKHSFSKGSEQLELFKTDLNNLVEDAIIAHSENETITALDYSDPKSAAFHQMFIDFNEQQIELGYTGQKIANQSNSVGTYAGRRVGLEIMDSVVDSGCSIFIAEFFTDVLQKMLNVNFKNPIKIGVDVYDADWANTVQLTKDKALVDTFSVEFTVDYIERTHGLIEGKDFTMKKKTPSPPTPPEKVNTEDENKPEQDQVDKPDEEQLDDQG